MQANKGLQITGPGAATQDSQHRHQQQGPLGVAHPSEVATIWREEAYQVISNGLIDSGRAGFGHWPGDIPLTKPYARRPAKGYVDKLLGAPEQVEHWQLEGRRMFSAECMAAIPALDALPAQARCRKMHP